MPLLVVSLGILVGTALGLLLPTPAPDPLSVLAALGLAAAGLVLGWPRRMERLLGLFVLAALLGGVRAHLDVTRIGGGTIPDGVTAVRGDVAETPRPAGRAAAFILDVSEVQREGQWQRWSTRVEARTFGWVPAEGDRVEVTGRMREIADLPGLPRATLLRRRHVTREIEATRVRLLAAAPAQAQAWRLSSARSTMERRVTSHLPGAEGALINGLLLGSRDGLSPELRAQFAATGTSHMVAVSGFNVVIVSGFVTAIIGRLAGLRVGALAAIVAVLVYTLVVGSPSSAVRAAVMASAVLLASVLRRPMDSLSALVLAAAGMTLVDPLVVQDLGFQLSVLATAGLILFIPRMTGLHPHRALAVGLVTTPLAAQIATLPLVLHTFHSISLVAILANVVIAFLVPAAMAAGGVLVLLADAGPLANLASWLAWAPSALILLAVRSFAALPGASIALGAFPWWAMLLTYGAMALLVLTRSPELGSATRLRPWLAGAAAGVLVSAAIGLTVAQAPDGRFSGELVEYGDLMIARTPSGRFMVLGATPSPTVFVGAIAERLPLWKRSVDLIIVGETSPAARRALEGLLARYGADVMLVPRIDLEQAMSPRVRQIALAAPETSVDLGDGVIALVRGTGVDRITELELRYGTTGLRVLNDVRRSEPSPGPAWLTVAQGNGQDLERLAMHGPVVRWGDAREPTGSGLVLRPAVHGPVRFSSDGAQLEITWSACDGGRASCSTRLESGAE